MPADNRRNVAQRPQVRRALREAATALGCSIDDFVKLWAAWSEEKKGEDELRGESIKDYLTANHGRRLTPRASFQLVSFLDEMAIQGSIVDGKALIAVRDLLRSLSEEYFMERNFISVQNDRTHFDAVPRFGGVYVVFRLETGGPAYQQELLFLLSKKVKGGYLNTALYVRPQIIYRGTWRILDGSLYCSLGGVDDQGHPRLNTLFITRDGADRTDVMCGVLAGIATAEKFPVVMPLVLTKLKVGKAGVTDLWKASDSLIRSSYQALDTRVNEESEQFRFLKVVAAKLPRIIIGPTDFAGDVRKAVGDLGRLVNPDILVWLNKGLPGLEEDLLRRLKLG